ncbi:MAG: ATP-dependent RecD-like DNA helicase [Deltaproteobacteria bacterium]|nr:ATP-dependent RecD-like DNA helicase [Myxococcales bacterium]MDP3214651.1 ATP-dependent RecD-like DNA helicase [Deltaproteobacteria bacterium]
MHDATEERARAEKAAALEEIFRARVSVLIGPAGTGKTTLLQILCALPEVKRGGLLLLAPTGKARVRLEEATGRRGEGMTLAQFLLRHQRFAWDTGRYFVNPGAPKAGGSRTVIVDECSMLTEDQFAALLDAISGVDRLIFVGDPRQLPPIGAGRPFVDIVRRLAPNDVETRFPRVAPSYAELTVIRRQDAERDDVSFARLFGGSVVDPGADGVWDRLASGTATGVRAVPWRDGRELQERLFAEIEQYIAGRGFKGDIEDAFAQSLGGSLYDGHVYFWSERDDRPGAAAQVEAWQVLSPLRAGLFGLEAINREVQRRYRAKALAMARLTDGGQRLVPKPAGPQGLLWGDKVINRVNNGRRRTRPKVENAYVANGDLGIAVGEFKTQYFTGTPENLEVEFSTMLGAKFLYWRSEFVAEEKDPELELAYALSVHQTQGSQFGRTFVVIPNPCRVLSREMLYTALTRQRDELVILHQGPLRDLWRYTNGYYSDVASRMTNLFEPADPREVHSRHDRTSRYLEDGLVHRTERGELVRSKSELLITSMLHARDVPYAYEEPLTVGAWRCLPDFTIQDDNRGVTFYWEHLGMLDDPRYARRWEAKRDEYRRAGIVLYEEGGGPSGTLLTTRDDVGGALDASRVAKLIDEVILGDWRPEEPP